jgi:hypothetical protein
MPEAFWHSVMVTRSVIEPGASQSSSTVRIAIFLSIALILANTISIGLRSGL